MHQSAWDRVLEQRNERNPWSGASTGTDNLEQTLLFDTLYVDFKGKQTKNEVLSSVLVQCNLHYHISHLNGAENNSNSSNNINSSTYNTELVELETTILKFIRTLRVNSVLIFDHVQFCALTILKKMLVTVGKNIRIIVIPDICLSAGAVKAPSIFTTSAGAINTQNNNNSNTTTSSSNNNNSGGNLTSADYLTTLYNNTNSSAYSSDYRLSSEDILYEANYHIHLQDYLVLLGINVPLVNSSDTISDTLSVANSTIGSSMHGSLHGTSSVPKLASNLIISHNSLNSKDSKTLASKLLSRIKGGNLSDSNSESPFPFSPNNNNNNNTSKNNLSSGADTPKSPKFTTNSTAQQIEIITQMARGNPYLITLLARQPLAVLEYVHSSMQTRNKANKIDTYEKVLISELFFEKNRSILTRDDRILVAGMYPIFYFDKQLQTNVNFSADLLFRLVKSTLTAATDTNSYVEQSAVEKVIRERFEIAWRHLIDIGWLSTTSSNFDPNFGMSSSKSGANSGDEVVYLSDYILSQFSTDKDYSLFMSDANRTNDNSNSGDNSPVLHSEEYQRETQSKAVQEYLSVMAQKYNELNAKLTVFAQLLTLPDIALHTTVLHIRALTLRTVDVYLQHFNILNSVIVYKHALLNSTPAAQTTYTHHNSHIPSVVNTNSYTLDEYDIGSNNNATIHNNNNITPNATPSKHFPFNKADSGSSFFGTDSASISREFSLSSENHHNSSGHLFSKLRGKAIVPKNSNYSPHWKTAILHMSTHCTTVTLEFCRELLVELFRGGAKEVLTARISDQVTNVLIKLVKEVSISLCCVMW